MYPHHIQKNTPASLLWAERHILSLWLPLRASVVDSRQPSRKGEIALQSPGARHPRQESCPRLRTNVSERLRLFPASRGASAGLGVRPLGFGCIRAGLAAVVPATRGGAAAQPRLVRPPARDPGIGGLGARSLRAGRRRGRAGRGSGGRGPGRLEESGGSGSPEPGPGRRATPRRAGPSLPPPGLSSPRNPAWADRPSGGRSGQDLGVRGGCPRAQREARSD